MLKILELGAGSRPRENAVNHDRVFHSPHIEIAWNLENYPWPWQDNEWDEIRANDVFEHMNADIHTWLSELHRILKIGGILTLRLPAWDNPLSYRDPTHKKVFHEETFDYFDPDKALYKEFGRFYWDTVPLFIVNYIGRENNDLVFQLNKI
jgi:SAM-dependent methyltransferase